MPCDQNPASAGPSTMTISTRIFARDGRSQNQGMMLSPNTASMSFQLSRMLSTPMAIGYSTLSRASSLCNWVSLAL